MVHRVSEICRDLPGGASSRRLRAGKPYAAGGVPSVARAGPHLAGLRRVVTPGSQSSAGDTSLGRLRPAPRSGCMPSLKTSPTRGRLPRAAPVLAAAPHPPVPSLPRTPFGRPPPAPLLTAPQGAATSLPLPLSTRVSRLSRPAWPARLPALFRPGFQRWRGRK